MPHHIVRRRLPQAGDPVLSSFDAISVISLAMRQPLVAETIAFFLDEDSCSSAITIVSDTTDPESVLVIAECLAMTGSQSPASCGLVLATVRPTGSPNQGPTLPGDLDRWVEADVITAAHGLELIEWFVIGPWGVGCPRDLLGDPQRW
ncbi:MAG: hypothetical protein ABI949_18090 [Ilumatobacteraceae bacterium]